MANGKRVLRFSAILIALAGVLVFHLEAMGMLDSTAEAEGRPDVIMIDTIARFGELEQPAAVFKHDVHTKALKAQGKSCEACHSKDAKGNMTLTFKGVEGDGTSELGASDIKKIYHDGCITCHNDTAEKNLESGPAVGECRSCHQEKPETGVMRADAGMDNVLHYAHWSSKEIPADKGKDTNCGACHKKSGEEDSWRVAAEKSGEPLDEVFHSKCVTCHQSLADKKAEKTGPVKCAGCHGTAEIADRKAEEAKKLAAMGGVLPRLPRKQPDLLMVMPKLEEGAKIDDKPSGMAPVAFNHKFHEENVDSCRTCHHKSVQACSSCHTQLGVEKDGVVSLDQAMHVVMSDRSCIGCHAKEQEKPECAGCHSLRTADKPASDASCKTCHVTPRDAEGNALALAGAPKEMKEAVAGQIIAERPQTHAVPAVDAIPEFVTIGAIADKFQASKMPHRKIVLKMLDNIKDSKLASTFHATPEAVCGACHHNSPATLTPPKCSSCHAVATDLVSGKPGLKAAYHGQCMRCHTEMKLEKPAATNCVACHEKKTN
ncbi:cytochrome c class III [Pseudodesulfovibrio cashew]|uniref:Cytochrome c class III n=1 Tax=Pseudodesulfovibrio cashew TaxID=2678688 RepID=A0A6I6JC48_9BACT|nr:cytochrome c3 family protein [Pseudodesulfovibrio cashew]QGY40355.1 cytochrome c class III [Pseudodesulfovibrio cashew]